MYGYSSSSAYRLDNLNYDAVGNITSLRRRNQTGAPLHDLTMSYPTANNRLSNYTNNAPNNQDYISYAYDANGNLTYFENGDYTTIVNMYHDAYNQLITVDDFWKSPTQYLYYLRQ